MQIAGSLTRLTQPLARKLPLLIAALLCVVVGAFGWLVERELRAAFESTAGERIGAAGQRLATMLATSAGALRTDAQRIASDSAIHAALVQPTTANLAAATARLTAAQAGRPDSEAHALWTVGCANVLSLGSSKSIAALAECPRGVTVSPSQHDVIQPLALHGDTVVYSIIAPVVRAPADTLGFYVRVRAFTRASNGRAVAALIGGDASLLIGNADGPDVWTDLSVRASGPPRTSARGVLTRYTGADNVEYLGEALDIPSTPWVVWVQMPLKSVMAPASRTLGKLTGIALGCILLGVAGAWFLSRRVTRPLADLTRAAEGMAAGDYARRVEGRRNDELGQLMAAFNQMASQVEKAKHALELSNLELTDSLAETRIAHYERELAQLLLEEVLDQSPVGIAVFNEDLQFLRLNRALAAMNGVPVLEHIARTPDEIAPALRTVEESCLRRVIETGQTISNQHSSGALLGGAKRYWMSSYFPVRGVLGETTGAGAIILETTAHHELEAQLLQAQKMEAVGRLAGGVAHDFNNLLTVISSYSEMALETLAPDDPLYGDMREIRSSADRASRLTRQLLAFSRKQVMQPQVLDLNRVSTEMERMLRRLIGEDVTLALDLTRELGEIKADPGQLEQVLMNLVLNARDATPDGGKLTIATANVSLAHDVTHDGVRIPAGEYVTLSVIDTGSGMTEETKAHLFEPFFTTKDSGQGTGLGLSTVYGIVKQSGGEIHVHSEMGRGSTFTAYFPRLPRQRGRISAPGAVMPYDNGGTETILVVEDDDALRELAQRILRSAGYLVLEASNANMAIDVGTNYEGEIHLLLTDVVMPQQNGRRVGARLTALRPGLRVLFMSGYNDEDMLRRGVSTAKSEFLPKPFTPEQLMRRVREVLDGDSDSGKRAG